MPMQEAVWYRNKEIQSGRTEMLDAGIPMPSSCMLNCHVHQFKIESFHLIYNSLHVIVVFLTLVTGRHNMQHPLPPLGVTHEKTCFWCNTYSAMDPATAAAQATPPHRSRPWWMLFTGVNAPPPPLTHSASPSSPFEEKTQWDGWYCYKT
jgi:hypothetical protein